MLLPQARLLCAAFRATTCSLRGLATEGSLSDKLWALGEPQRNDALKSDFIQQMAKGTLDPSVFGAFMVQESVFWQEKQGFIETASRNKSIATSVAEALKVKSQKYDTLQEDLLTKWHINRDNDIEMNQGFRSFESQYRRIAENQAIYTIVLVAARIHLWNWIGIKIEDEQDNYGVYKTWIDGHLKKVGNKEDYQELEKLIDAQATAGAMSEGIATSVYKECMENEAKLLTTPN